MPVVDTGDAGCRAFNNDVVAFLNQHRQFGSVILASSWRQPTEPAFTDANGRHVQGAEAEAAFSQALYKSLGRLRSTGVRTYVWDALPAMPGPVPQNMARNLAFGSYWSTTSSQETYDRTFRFLHTAFDRHADLIAGRINAAPALCTADMCRAEHRGRPVFEDNNHPAFVQAAFFADIIAREMASVPAPAPRR